MHHGLDQLFLPTSLPALLGSPAPPQFCASPLHAARSPSPSYLARQLALTLSCRGSQKFSLHLDPEALPPPLACLPCPAAGPGLDPLNSVPSSLHAARTQPLRPVRQLALILSYRAAHRLPLYLGLEALPPTLPPYPPCPAVGLSRAPSILYLPPCMPLDPPAPHTLPDSWFWSSAANDHIDCLCISAPKLCRHSCLPACPAAALVWALSIL